MFFIKALNCFVVNIGRRFGKRKYKRLNLKDLQGKNDSMEESIRRLRIGRFRRF